MATITKEEVTNFSEHCLFVYSINVYLERIYGDGSDKEHSLMKGISQHFFDNLFLMLREYRILAVCRITDPAGKGDRQNLTLEAIANEFTDDAVKFKHLNDLRSNMEILAAKLRPARNKIAAHSDRLTVSSNAILGEATAEEWKNFWGYLADFIRSINQYVKNTPFELNYMTALVDADMFMLAIKKSHWFDLLNNSHNDIVRQACAYISTVNS
jgi:AbiU2